MSLEALTADLRRLRSLDVFAAGRRKLLTFLRFRASSCDVRTLLSSQWFSESSAWQDPVQAIAVFAALYECNDWTLASRATLHLLCDTTLRALGTARHEDLRAQMRAGLLVPGG
jgi:hypothetical protein